jgi:mannose-1-phosphate guanylyltransferase/mannose-6-phosphate isomerase
MYPKQLLPLVGKHTMLQETVLRTEGMTADAGPPIVVCNEMHRFLVAEQLAALNIAADILLEPEGRNTAPATALAAFRALQDVDDSEPGPLLLVMPADHVIKDGRAFREALEVGRAVAGAGQLVTFGVVPTYPHTGYGYIEADAMPGEAAPVLSFIEKPNSAKAVELLRSDRNFWNAGIFLFAARDYLDELEKWRPEIVAACRESYTKGVADADFFRPNDETFRGSPSDSIDYAVMENTDRAAVVPLDAGWSDVGSWDALHEISAQDENGNAVSGDVIAIDCEQSYISGNSRLVTAVGVKDVVIVEDKDSVLIAGRNESQKVKDLVDELKRRGREERNLHRQVFRPWGSYDSVDSDDGFQVKRLIVKPGAVLSLQKHAHRAEHWVVVRGTARITRDDEVFDLTVNQSTYIPIGAVHRIENPGDEPVHIIEVQCGDYLGEDDIVRLEDNYGREGTNT